mmetsp:Transcript_24803/g.46348  ORF Transcript_24803/g.46348 Transcript_24803/m.46348 type:complete len:221 (-) Transcript_24803:190-852(-)
MLLQGSSLSTTSNLDERLFSSMRRPLRAPLATSCSSREPLHFATRLTNRNTGFPYWAPSPPGNSKPEFRLGPRKRLNLRGMRDDPTWLFPGHIARVAHAVSWNRVAPRRDGGVRVYTERILVHSLWSCLDLRRPRHHLLDRSARVCGNLHPRVEQHAPTVRRFPSGHLGNDVQLAVSRDRDRRHHLACRPAQYRRCLVGGWKHGDSIADTHSTHNGVGRH